MSSNKLGKLGEKVAIKYLKNRGYKILDRNYVNKFLTGPQRGEIDIITKKDNIINFVEVKTLKTSKDNHLVLENFLPEDRVNFLKQKKIMKTAESWLIEKKIPLDNKWQIDVISIMVDPEIKTAKIKYFQNV